MSFYLVNASISLSWLWTLFSTKAMWERYLSMMGLCLRGDFYLSFMNCGASYPEYYAVWIVYLLDSNSDVFRLELNRLRYFDLVASNLDED